MKEVDFLESDYLASIVESSADAIMSIDLNGTITSWNKGAEDLFGYKAKEIIGKHYYKIVPKELRDEIEQLREKVLKKGHLRNYETYRLHKDGRKIPVNLTISVIKDKNGKLIGTSGIFKDLSEKKKLEDEIRKTKDYLEGIIEASADAIVTTSIDGKILSWNKGAEEIYGYAAEEVVGKPVLELYPPELRKERKRWVKELLKGGTIRNRKTKIYNKHGKLVDINLSLSLLRDEKGSPIATVGVSKDVSKEVKLEQRLKEHAHELEEKSKEVESFVYAISHDLKSPIISIQGFASALASEYGGKLGDEARFYLERIKKNSELMDDLITDLLELSRIGRISQPFEKVNAAEIVGEICKEFSHRFKNIKFRMKKLPVIHCEKNRIVQVFNNLIGNSVRYIGTPEKPFVEVGCTDAGSEWKFYVKDNGIGIPREYHVKLFKPFQRIPSEKAKGVKGTGLGLAIVKKIIDFHKGRVWVESEVGKGSTFYFTMPK